MRRGRRAIVSALLVLFTACGSTSKGTVVTPTKPATTSTVAAVGTTAAAVGTTVAASAGASTTTAPTVASIVPEVVCVGNPSPDPRSSGNPRPDVDEPVYFGYTSSATTPVAVPKGPDNRVEGMPDDDDPLAPTVFVPGRLAPAFLTFVAAPTGSLPSWTVRGPDGVVHTATITASTPGCTDALVKPPFPDARKPTLSFSMTTLPAGSTSPTQVELVSTLVGLPALSTCAAGLDPLAPIVTFDDGVGGAPTTGSVGHQTLALTQMPILGTGTTYLGARALPYFFVVDRCRGAGAVTSAWPTADALVALREGTKTCIKVDGAQATVVTSSDECQSLAYTGGVRTRRPTPQG